MLLYIKALPGASHTEIAGFEGDRVRIRIAAAAENGKANTELIAFLAKKLGCAKRELVLKAGARSRMKTLAVPDALRAAVSALFKN